MAHAQSLPARSGVLAGSQRQSVAFVRWFAQLTRNDAASVGGKGANLGEMTRAIDLGQRRRLDRHATGCRERRATPTARSRTRQSPHT
jgi:hypothetical protein